MFLFNFSLLSFLPIAPLRALDADKLPAIYSSPTDMIREGSKYRGIKFPNLVKFEELVVSLPAVGEYIGAKVSEQVVRYAGERSASSPRSKVRFFSTLVLFPAPFSGSDILFLLTLYL